MSTSRSRANTDELKRVITETKQYNNPLIIKEGQIRKDWKLAAQASQMLAILEQLE